MFICVFVLVLTFVGSNCEFASVPNGLLKGTAARSRDGRGYRQFLGIPYAEPPVGNLRFQVSDLFMNSDHDMTNKPVFF